MQSDIELHQVDHRSGLPNVWLYSPTLGTISWGDQYTIGVYIDWNWCIFVSIFSYQRILERLRTVCPVMLIPELLLSSGNYLSTVDPDFLWRDQGAVLECRSQLESWILDCLGYSHTKCGQWTLDGKVLRALCWAYSSTRFGIRVNHDAEVIRLCEMSRLFNWLGCMKFVGSCVRELEQRFMLVRLENVDSTGGRTEKWLLLKSNPVIWESICSPLGRSVNSELDKSSV